MATGDILILGGGLAGLGAAHALWHGGARRGFTLLERAERLGGLCRTDARDGFLFDRTGHWLHLRDPEVQALVRSWLGDALVEITRRAAVYAQGVFLDYPYQTSFGGLPDRRIVAENLLGFLDAHLGPGGADLRARELATFEEFALRHVGRGIADNFLLPFNRKLWTVEPAELSAAWTGRFVPRPTLEEVVRGALGLPVEGQGYNARFLYPREGGIEALPRAIAATLPAERLRTGRRPVELDPVGRTLRLDDGAMLRFPALISTIPLPALVRLCGARAPDAVHAAAAALRATTVTYVNVGARATGRAPFHWAYFAEPRFPFYRIGAPSSVLPSLAPAGLRSFCVEFSHRGALSKAEAEAQAVQGLVDVGYLAAPGDALFAEAHELENAYVIHDAAHGPARATILDWFAGHGIASCGRYGGWEYSSMEDALRAGARAARTVEALAAGAVA